MGELLYWHKSINFGDMLSPYLLARFKGVSIEEINYVEANDEREKYVLTGSILSAPITNATIFGAGFIDYSDTFTGTNIRVKGVRGFHTLNKLKEFMEVPDDVLIGDPSYCLPLFYAPKPEKKYYLGIIPHIMDYEYVSSCHKGEGISVIDLRMQDYETIEQTVERVIFQICQCKAVVSGSLHGLIVAAAYDVPIISRLPVISGRVLGDGFKFDDYESAGKPDVEKIMEAGLLLNTLL